LVNLSVSVDSHVVVFVIPVIYI